MFEKQKAVILAIISCLKYDPPFSYQSCTDRGKGNKNSNTYIVCVCLQCVSAALCVKMNLFKMKWLYLRVTAWQYKQKRWHPSYCTSSFLGWKEETLKKRIDIIQHRRVRYRQQRNPGGLLRHLVWTYWQHDFTSSLTMQHIKTQLRLRVSLCCLQWSFCWLGLTTVSHWRVASPSLFPLRRWHVPLFCKTIRVWWCLWCSCDCRFGFAMSDYGLTNSNAWLTTEHLRWVVPSLYWPVFSNKPRGLHHCSCVV